MKILLPILLLVGVGVLAEEQRHETVTKLKRQLLMNYDAETIPASSKMPVQVEVSLSMMYMDLTDKGELEFTAYCSFKWQDKRLSWKNEDFANLSLIRMPNICGSRTSKFSMRLNSDQDHFPTQWETKITQRLSTLPEMLFGFHLSTEKSSATIRSLRTGLGANMTAALSWDPGLSMDSFSTPPCSVHKTSSDLRKRLTKRHRPSFSRRTRSPRPPGRTRSTTAAQMNPTQNWISGLKYSARPSWQRAEKWWTQILRSLLIIQKKRPLNLASLTKIRWIFTSCSSSLTENITLFLKKSNRISQYMNWEAK